MEYRWINNSDFNDLSLREINVDFQVLDNEIYDDKDYPWKKNFKHPWNLWQGVEVRYLVNNRFIVSGFRGKTVWYIPAESEEVAKAIGVEKGQALKIVKYPVHDSVLQEYERLISELTIQKILAKNDMAPNIYEVVIAKNIRRTIVRWFDEDYFHPNDCRYLTTIVEHKVNDGLPNKLICLESNGFFTGELIDEFEMRCKNLRIQPYDLCLGNIFYNKALRQPFVVDVHKWKRTYEVLCETKPSYLQIELNNTCNAQCKMCYVPRIKRQRGKMKDDLLIKILEEAQILGIKYIAPFLHGEPFLRKDFIEKLHIINDYVPDAEIYIHTNASMLSHKIIDQLKKVKNIRKIFFSFPGGTQEAYEKTTGLDFNSSYENIKYAWKHLNLEKKIIMPMCLENKSSEEQFFEIWRNYQAESYNTYNYLGNVTGTLSKTSFEHCDRIIRSMTVLYDGRVSLCCMDADGSYIFGNLNNSHISEVWNSKDMLEIRRKHLISRLYSFPCNNCTQNLYVQEYNIKT